MVIGTCLVSWPDLVARWNVHVADRNAHCTDSDWDEAERCFSACRNLVPADGPSTTFLTRISAFRREPPPAGWDGVWRISAK